MGLQQILDNAGKTPGLEIWRVVENFDLQLVPTEDHGKFYCQNSYLVVSTFEKEGSELAWNTHFWIGKQLEHDEYGAGASMVAKLDEINDDIPSQYREMQENESELFLSYFEDPSNRYGTKLRYIENSADTANDASDGSQTSDRLLKIKHRKTRVRFSRLFPTIILTHVQQ